jgi:TATA-box binding protein (TBP) (component of TFIID and TFIIIB)
MNPNQTNARIVFPVTTFETVMRGHKIDYILYANNYEEVDNEHPVIERLESPEKAFKVFRSGAVMSKGTTTSTGLVNSYFANIFGPPNMWSFMIQSLADTFRPSSEREFL